MLLLGVDVTPAALGAAGAGSVPARQDGVWRLRREASPASCLRGAAFCLVVLPCLLIGQSRLPLMGLSMDLQVCAALRWPRLDISSTSILLGRNRMSGCGVIVPHLTGVGWALDVRCRPLDHLYLVVCLPLRCDGEVFGHRWCLWGNVIWRSPHPYCWDFHWCYCLRCLVADPS